MSLDPAIRNHQAWIGYLQPDGLVVSAAALVDSQVFLDQNLLPLQQRFLAFVREVEINEDDAFAVENFTGFVKEFLEWPEDSLFGLDEAHPLPDELKVPLPELGETLHPSFAMKEAKPKDPTNPWLLLIKVLPLGEDLDTTAIGKDAQWSASPSRRFERLLRETKVPIGVLTNGLQIRIIYAPRGENSGSMTFPVQAMTEVAGRPILGALHMLLHRYRLFSAPSEARLPALLERSRAYQSRVSEKLANQVLDSLYELLRGFQAADERAKRELLREVLANKPNDVYGGLLTVLLRLVFLLYAEDRALMPNSSTYAQNYSVHGLFERLRADYERYPDTIDQRYGAWSQLLALFSAVFNGCRHPQLKMPARKGFLFDPDRYSFLDGRSTSEHHVPLVSDGVLFRVLRNLLILDGERLSYRTLDVEQIGSVYETMVGFRLEVAEGPTIAVKPAKAKGAPTAINLDDLLAAKPDDRAKWLREKADQKLSGEATETLKTATNTDGLLAVLERRIARSATPGVVSKGGMVLQPSDERRRSGSHYTPRSLTEPIVRKTLEPILKRLGEKPTPEQILDLKIADIAVGSGAFLVEASRQLGDELVRAWHNHSKVPYIPPDEDEVLHARRLVAQRCLYGVDRNLMAVDLAKLSLWLATLAKDHPFTFLDHAIRCGDSLVGLTRKQIADFHWRPDAIRVLGQDVLEQRVEKAARIRKEILEADELTSPVLKREKLDKADEALNHLRLVGDLVIAAFFAADKERARLSRRDEYLAQYVDFFKTYNQAKNVQGLVDILHGDPFPVVPFHWAIEFPEVFERESPGFDAVVGNPPFIAKNAIASLGEAYRAWLALVPDTNGKSDIVAFFFRKAFEILNAGGTLGMIATGTVAQGDTRAAGLTPICTRLGGTIFAATTNLRWPGLAAVQVSVIHIAKGLITITPILNGRQVDRITAYLFHKGSSRDPARLQQNSGVSFQGCNISGQGFLFADDAVGATSTTVLRELRTASPSISEAVFPYLGGADINSSATLQSGRFVIGFGRRELQDCRHRWPELVSIVERLVKPDREARPKNDQQAYLASKWWQWHTDRPTLQTAVAALDRVLVGSAVTARLAFVFVPKTVVCAHSLNVFALDRYSSFAAMQSRVHEEWAHFFSSSLEDRLRYTPTDCFETFPFPEQWRSLSDLEASGRMYYEFRAEFMVSHDEGLTKTYNRFHDPEETSPDIIRLRELHEAMDRAVLDAYGWTDIKPTCEFILDYEEEEDEEESGRRRKKPWRYRWPDDIRDEVLTRLLALNKERAEEEKLAGEGAKDGRKSKTKGRKKKVVIDVSQETLQLRDHPTKKT